MKKILLTSSVVILALTAPFNIAFSLTIYPTNSGFEQPDLGSGASAFQYVPSSPGWSFGPSYFPDGIAANGSDFNVVGATNFNNDNGATSMAGQAAFLQGGDGTLGFTSFSQTLTLPAGDWTLNFSLEGRANLGPNGVNVFLNGVQVGSTLFPASSSSFNDTNLNLGHLSAGRYTIAFAGNGDVLGGDRTTFIDNVSLSAPSVPDSGSTVVLLVGSFAGLLVCQRLLRRNQLA